LGVIEYVETGRTPVLPPTAAMAFSFIGAQLERDRQKFEDKKEKNRRAGSNGGKAKARAHQEARKEDETGREESAPVSVAPVANASQHEKKVANVANAKKEGKMLANLAENGNENVNEYVYENGNENVNEYVYENGNVNGNVNGNGNGNENGNGNGNGNGDEKGKNPPDKRSGGLPAACGSPPIPLKKSRSTYGVMPQELQKWQQQFPAVDVPTQLVRIAKWLTEHPMARQTRAGTKTFIERWLCKEQEKGGIQNGQRYDAGNFAPDPQGGKYAGRAGAMLL
ncbi:MAG: DUF6291 domain-containing protein, partial [Acutalibacteraceae bacterium]